jgi:SAM-dependent methyltransferase
LPTPSNAATCPACHAPLIKPLGEKNGYRFFGCAQCGTAAVVPLPTQADLAAHYKAYYNTPNYMRKSEAKLAQAKSRIARLGGTPGQSFLDIGCNAGFAVEAARRAGFDAHGIEIDPEAVAAAKAAWGDRFEVATAEDYAASGRRAEIVYTSEVIEHTPTPESFAAALGRIVKPLGKLFLTTPDAGHWRVPAKFTAWNEVKPPVHLILYSREGLRRLLGRHGFGGFRFEWKLKPRITLHASRLA